MKVIKKLDAADENDFVMLLRISHENILRYFDHFDHVIDDLDHTCVITEYCEASSSFKLKFELIKLF